MTNNGNCLKCGAPYLIPTGAWFGIIPPAPIPTCNCWNNKVTTSSSSTNS